MKETSLKQKEIGDIPEGWEVARLVQLTEKISSGATPKGGKESYSRFGISLIRSQNVLNEGFSRSGLAFIDEGQAKELDNVTVISKDVLLNITGDSVARSCMVPDNVLPARVNQHVLVIRTKKDKLHPLWLRYFLIESKTQQHLFSLASSGATRQALTKGMIEELQISVPSITEQENLTKILFNLDAKIELNQQMNKTLECIAQALFKQWFVDDADPMWPIGGLGDICERITKGTTPTTLKKSYVESGINFIKVESIDEFGNLLPDKFAHIDNDTNLMLSRSIIQENDILYTIAGTIGRIAVVNLEALPANTNQAVAIIRLRNKSLYLSYIRLLLKTSGMSKKFKSKVVHAVQPNLSLGEISETQVSLPEEQVLTKFNQLVNPMFLKIRENTTQINILSQIRDSLLPRLMAGKIRVNSFKGQYGM
ncbi:MAG: restriction endonuclease subunit S [Candidatus Omnitrophica bacterium]|nr:restriction endonuclease subunit S [Candidatus Omnitrophota bacterium]